MTVEDLKESANALFNSKFNKGENILFCVDYGLWLSSNIHSRLFSTAEKALNFANSFNEEDYVKVYPCFDIWHNPRQIDI